MNYIGIDPGLGGAIARISLSSSGMAYLNVYDMPTIDTTIGGRKRRVVNLVQLQGIMQVSPGFAVIEKVNAMPKQGVSSVFRFGEVYGMCQAATVLSGHALEYVTPAKWKRDMQVPAAKDATRFIANQIMPTCGELWKRKKDADRAEAALLAWWLAFHVHQNPIHQVHVSDTI